jgi:predicted alpha/beta hydrolase
MIASEPIRVEASDGFALAATVFRPPSIRTVRQVVLVCSAMGVRQSYYFDFAECLAERGLAVITFDYRGVGSSAPSRLNGFRADLEDWGRLDVAALIDLARREFPSIRLSVVAHSVGGQVFGLAPNCSEVSDVLAFGSQSGYWRHWRGAWRLRVWCLWYVAIPLLSRTMGYFPAGWFGLGRNIPSGVAQRWAHWGRHPDYVVGRVDAAGREGYRCFAGRLRLLTSEDDLIAPVPAARALLEFYPAARREFRIVRPAECDVAAIGHFGYFRESIGKKLWHSELAWLEQPSHEPANGQSNGQPNGQPNGSSE